MRIIACLTADLERSPLGTRSQLRDELAGVPILRRTVERVLRAKQAAGVFVITPAAQAPAVRELLSGLDAHIETYDGAEPPYAALVRAGRVWGLDGWRGGIGSLCAFDEDVLVGHTSVLADREKADAVLCVHAAAPLVDPDLLDAMIAHYEANIEQAKITLVQAPPGIGGVILGRDVLTQLAPSGQPPGALLIYQPDNPAPDAAGKEACYRPAAEVIEARGRLICDTRRSRERVQALLDAGGDSMDAREVGRRLNERRFQVEPEPCEIEIELTTDDPLWTASRLRPRGARVPKRGPIDPGVIERALSELQAYDDVRVVLGGFGEPCAHPEFASICRMIRDAGIMAIAARTNAGVDGTDVEDALFETPIDAVEIMLDAITRETYLTVNGVDAFDAVRDRLERWAQRRTAQTHVTPLLVPSFVKTNENLHEMEPFYDMWQRRFGSVLVTGHSQRAGQFDNLAVMSMAPPQRGPCRRVFRRFLILADGSVTTCDQDFAGKQTIGHAAESPILELWRNAPRLDAIRRHEINDQPLCPACDEWHRP